MNSANISSKKGKIKDSQVEWLVIFLVLDIYELKNEIARLKKDMEGIDVKDKVKIFFIKDSVQRIHGGNRLLYELRTFEIKYVRSQSKTGFIPFKIQEVDYEANYAFADAIVALTNKYNAKNSVLITWSHGARIALFNNDDPTKLFVKGEYTSFNDFYLLRNQSIKTDHIQSSILEKFQNGVFIKKNGILNCKNLEKLFVSEIANSLYKRIPKKFDMVIMSNCNMQTIDCCYNLKDITDYFIAGVTGLDPMGYDFVSFIKKINNFKREKINYKKLSTKLINDYWKKNRNSANTDNQAIIANRLNFISEGWVRNFENLIKYLKVNRDKTYPIIYNVTINKINELGDGSCFFDAISLFRYLRDDLRDKKFNKYFLKFYDKVSDSFVYSRIGKTIKADDRNSKKKYGINNFSLYLYSPVDDNIPIAEVMECQYWKNQFDLSCNCTHGTIL